MISALATAVIPALLLPWALLPLRIPLLFTLLPTIPVAVVYARAVARRETTRAFVVALAWAVAWSVATIAAVSLRPDAPIKGVWHAGAYREEMVRWIATGAGPEGNIALFLPRLLLELAIVLVLSAATAGTAGLLLGAVLLGYMNSYVGWVAASADKHVGPVAASLIAWPPWAAARVVGFIAAATAAALWGYPRFVRRGTPRSRLGGFVVAAVLLLALDVFLKWWLAPLWREWLRTILGASAGIEAGGSA